MPTVNEALADKATEHAIGLIRVSTATANKIVALLNRADPDILRQIQERVGDVQNATDTRLDALLTAIRQINRDVYDKVQHALEGDLIELAHYEASYQLDLLNDTLPIKWDTVAPAPQTLAAAVNSQPFNGALLREVVAGLEEGRARRLRDAIRLGVVEGETVDQIVRRVRGTKALNYKDGILEISRRSAEGAVRTAVNHVVTRAREATYKANDDLISKVMWISTIDNRTSAVCRARDRKTYPVDSGPRPPAHWNCRSTTAPITKSWRELGIDADEADAGTRASLDGQIPEEMSYDDWLRTKPADYQDEILGKAKGKLFRAGLKLDRFVDRAGNELSLDALRKKEAGAFKRAGL